MKKMKIDYLDILYQRREKLFKKRKSLTNKIIRLEEQIRVSKIDIDNINKELNEILNEINKGVRDEDKEKNEIGL